MFAIRHDGDREAFTALVVEPERLVRVSLCEDRVQVRQENGDREGIVQWRTGAQAEDGVICCREKG